MSTKLHIAIDGPAGAGKSTIAKAIAKELDILHLDTGAMYRTLALYAFNMHVDPRDEKGVTDILDSADVKVSYKDGAQYMLLNGKDVTAFIRTPEISKGASDIGVHPVVRKKLTELQQRVAEQNSVVMDGRDIATVVMPNAPCKFFVTASPRIRAERRLLEMREKGETDLPSIDEMERAIRDRDHTDSSRAAAPLKQAEGAVLVDTTNMTIEQSIQFVINHINKQ